jgi:hypothetical protein
MRFNLTQASYRVFERASQLRLQQGIAAISSAKILWALFDEDECRAAYWLQEAGLSLEEFQQAFGIQTFSSPISAPSFPAGSYGVSAGQYTPPAPPSPALDAIRAGKDSPSVGTPFPGQLPHSESEDEAQDEQSEPPQDLWEPAEQPKYSPYPQRQQGQKVSKQSRLQFYLDDQWINIGLLTPELEDNLEMVAHRFVREDNRQPISVSGGIKQIAIGASAFTLMSEHLLLAVAFDNGDVGRWLRENGLETTELYQRIDALIAGEMADGRRQAAEEPTAVSPVFANSSICSTLSVCPIPFNNSTASCIDNSMRSNSSLSLISRFISASMSKKSSSVSRCSMWKS